MYRYLFKRVIMLIPIMIGITFIIFSIMDLTPGDPGTIVLGPMATPEEIKVFNEQLGYNKSFMIRYFDYLLNAIRGDFGTSYITGLPVFNEIFLRFPVTLNLTMYSIVLTIIIALPLGILAALKQHSSIDGASMVLALFLASVPVFWLGLMLILVFALELKIVPSFGADSFKHYILPSVTTAAATIAIITRMTRATMLEVLRHDYIRTAKAKGVNSIRLIWKHAIRNCLIPVVTLLGINFGLLLGGTVLVETVFAMPGVGTLLVEAIRQKDTPVVLGAVTLLGICFCLINLLVDLSYGYLDPRIKV
ncbi:MAG: ABC transporter permease [Clostridia bacterium]|nr:ABC transporter permease [Clostridia bacterium]